MTAVIIAAFIGGIIQPYLQEFILKNKVSSRTALALAAGFSIAIAAIAFWVVGGFAGIIIPQFTLRDPSPLLAAFLPYATAVFSLSQLVFHGTESTTADPHVVVGTAATTPVTPTP